MWNVEKEKNQRYSELYGLGNYKTALPLTERQNRMGRGEWPVGSLRKNQERKVS